MPRRSPSPFSPSKVFASAAFCLAAALPGQAAVATSGDSTVVELGVFFCDGDLACDPEENYQSCPSDCEAPPDPSPEPDPEPEQRRPSGSASARESVGAVARPTGDAGAGGGVSSKPVDPQTSLLADTLDVTNENMDDRVEFSWASLDGAEVRVLRADGSDFPTTPYDGGIVVYEGNGSGFLDEIPNGETGRYAAFVRQPDGSYGARLLVVVAKVETPPIVEPEGAQSLWEKVRETARSPWSWIPILAGILLGLFTRLKPL